MKREVKEPKFAWGGVDHDDVGKVAKIMNSSEHGEYLWLPVYLHDECL